MIISVLIRGHRLFLLKNYLSFLLEIKTNEENIEKLLSLQYFPFAKELGIEPKIELH